MSISSKIQTAQEKVDEIFQLLKNYNVETSNENNLINLKNDLANYFNQKQFTLIDYAYANGNQYFDTGISMQNNIAVELKFMIEDNIENESLGGFITEDGIEFNILKNHDSNFESSTSLEDTYIINAIDDKIHFLIYNTYGRRLLFDDIQKTFVKNITPLEEKNLLIFANSHEGIKPTGRIYSCKIYDISTGNILRFFIPVIDSNDTTCFFDIVTQKFYYSQGDEDFY